MIIILENTPLRLPGPFSLAHKKSCQLKFPSAQEQTSPTLVLKDGEGLIKGRTTNGLIITIDRG